MEQHDEAMFGRTGKLRATVMALVSKYLLCKLS